MPVPKGFNELSEDEQLVYGENFNQEMKTRRLSHHCPVIRKLRTVFSEYPPDAEGANLKELLRRLHAAARTLPEGDATVVMIDKALEYEA